MKSRETCIADMQLRKTTFFTNKFIWEMISITYVMDFQLAKFDCEQIEDVRSLSNLCTVFRWTKMQNRIL